MAVNCLQMIVDDLQDVLTRAWNSGLQKVIKHNITRCLNSIGTISCAFPDALGKRQNIVVSEREPNHRCQLGDRNIEWTCIVLLLKTKQWQEHTMHVLGHDNLEKVISVLCVSIQAYSLAHRYSRLFSQYQYYCHNYR